MLTIVGYQNSYCQIDNFQKYQIWLILGISSGQIEGNGVPLSFFEGNAQVALMGWLAENGRLTM